MAICCRSGMPPVTADADMVLAPRLGLPTRPVVDWPDTGCNPIGRALADRAADADNGFRWPAVLIGVGHAIGLSVRQP